MFVTKFLVDCVWNVVAHAQKPDFVFRRNGRVHLNRQGRQFSRILAAKLCAPAVVMLDTPCSEVVWRVLATLSIRQFPLHFSSRASPCAIRFQLDSNRNANTDKAGDEESMLSNRLIDMIYLLTAIRLITGGSSSVHIYTQTIHRKTQWNRISRTEHI